MLQLPSLRKPFSEFVSLDPAFVQLSAEADAATVQLHQEKWQRARETGDYSELRIAGVPATTFTFRFLTGDQDRKLPSIALSNRELWQLAFRCALVKLDNAGDIVLEHETHPQLGTIVAKAVTDRFDALNPAIVDELGILALLRGTGHLTPHR